MNGTPKNRARGHGDTTVASAVLLYDLDGSTVTASLLSPIDGSELGPTESIDLENFSPEQIGLTVPMLWDLVDVAEANVMCVVTSGAAADIDVAPPILELAFGVPVFDSPTPTAPSAAADEVAPWQRAESAVTAAPTRPVPSLRPIRPVPATPVRRSATGAGKSGVVKSGSPATSLVKKTGVARAGIAGSVAAAAAAAAARPSTDTPLAREVVEPEVVEPEVVEVAAVEVAAVEAQDAPSVDAPDTEVFPVVAAPIVIDQFDDARTEAIPVVGAADAPAGRRRSRRVVGLAGAAAAVALVAAGIGTAAALSGGSDSPAQGSVVAEQAPAASTTDGTPSSSVDTPVVADAPVAPAPAAPVAPPPVPAEDPAAAADGWTDPTAASAPWTQAPWTPAPWTPTPAAPAPTQWSAPPPAPSSSSSVPAPQFTVPVPKDDPSKSLQQRQDEAWAEHWSETGQWLNQEFPQ